MTDEPVDYEITIDDAETYGYGDIGNMATLMMFRFMLNEEEARDYREELMKEDKKAYEEYLEFEREFKENVDNY